MEAQYDKLSQQQINILQIDKETLPKQSITYSKDMGLVSYLFPKILAKV